MVYTATTYLSFVFLELVFLLLRHFHECAQLQARLVADLQFFCVLFFGQTSFGTFSSALYKTQNSITISTATPNYFTF